MMNQKRTIGTWVLMLYLSVSCGQSTNTTPGQQKLADSDCDHPDAPVGCRFVHMPATLTSVMKINYEGVPGTPMFIKGVLYKSDGKTPWPGVILYGYHTDSKGYYSKRGNEKGIQKVQGQLHGWCKSDSHGRYEIQSIRPAPYPGNQNPAHIHLVVQLPETGKMFYINDIVFDDDPIVKRMQESNPNHSHIAGVMTLKKQDGVWRGNHDIILKPQ